jgi:peptide chain release factor subunit 1
VLLGAPDELLSEFKAKLHPYLAERIVGKISVDIENASLDDVCAAAEEAITAHTMRSEREALDRLAQGVGTGGRGAAGIAEVLDALNQARVETLLISENFRASGRVDF